MSQIAFLFPGQGSQSIGMGLAVADNFPASKTYFDQAQRVLGWDLLEACRQGPDDRLKQTDVAQPALYVTGYAAYKTLESHGLKPQGVAGHSIGEYAALAAAGVFGFVEGLELVKARARLMKEAGQSNPGSMMAILGLEGAQVKAVCQEASAKGVVAAVNFNSPEQTVIAGTAAGLEEAGRLASAKGAKRVIPLNVAGAFHSPLMAEAAQGMMEMIAKPSFNRAAVPVAMNADGRLHQAPEDIRQQLELQLDHAVLWVASIQPLKADGAHFFVECGAGRVLTGLLRRIDRQLPAYATDTLEAIKELEGALQAAQ
jgi:[acyl-carrier-protein] S-malonyltransferase